MVENKLMETTNDNIDPVAEFYETVAQALEFTNGKSPFGDFLFNNIKSGKKTVYSKSVRENRIYETDFLDILQSSYPSIAKIIKDPKKSIRYEQEVVGVEKAKKIDATTVRHLASHTHLIKSIEQDNVIPSKVLTTFAEEELAIYENRFIKTLLLRVDKFLEIRYDLIKDNLESFQSDRVKITNDFKLQDNFIKMELDISVKKDIEESTKKAELIFGRLTNIRDLFKGLKNSEFMQALKTAKQVTPPIMKTNIILKNPDFKIAYALWIFLDRYEGLGYDVNVKETQVDLDPVFSEDVDLTMLMLLSTAINNQKLGLIDIENLGYKEYINKRIKNIKKLEDELSINPENSNIEKDELTEFFLEELKKYYSKIMREQFKKTDDRTSVIKHVYKNMLDTNNLIYPSLFELNIEETDISFEQKLQNEKKKVKLIKVLKDLKQADLNKMLKEEERSNKEITKLEEKINKTKNKENKKPKKAKKVIKKHKPIDINSKRYRSRKVVHKGTSVFNDEKQN